MNTDRSSAIEEKDAYYERRLADAARLMPVLGVGLFLFPLFWIAPAPDPAGTALQGAEPPARTVVVMFYLFIVWIALAAMSGLVSRRLGGPKSAPKPPPSAPDP